MYIALALLLLLGIGGIVVWKVTNKPTAMPIPTVTATVAASTAAANTAIDEIPFPPPVIEAGPASVRTGGVAGDPCGMTTCNGNVAAGSETERGLQMLARSTRRKCYDPALANDPSLQGHVKLQMKIAANGQICSATVAENDMSNGSVAECAARMLLGAGRVPSPLGGCVNLKFPMNFVPMGQH
jgi:hypothetical protein